MELPAIQTSPWSGGKIPVKMLIKVVLPEPFGPKRPKICPRLRANETV